MSNETVLPSIKRFNEFVTPDFFGNLPGDPDGGKTRVITDNGVGGFCGFFVGK